MGMQDTANVESETGKVSLKLLRQCWMNVGCMAVIVQ